MLFHIYEVFTKILFQKFTFRVPLTLALVLRKKSELLSHQDLGMFALVEVNKTLQAMPPKLRRDVEMSGNQANKKKQKKRKQLNSVQGTYEQQWQPSNDALTVQR